MAGSLGHGVFASYCACNEDALRISPAKWLPRKCLHEQLAAPQQVTVSDLEACNDLGIKQLQLPFWFEHACSIGLLTGTPPRHVFAGLHCFQLLGFQQRHAPRQECQLGRTNVGVPHGNLQESWPIRRREACGEEGAEATYGGFNNQGLLLQTS